MLRKLLNKIKKSHMAAMLEDNTKEFIGKSFVNFSNVAAMTSCGNEELNDPDESQLSIWLSSTTMNAETLDK